MADKWLQKASEEMAAKGTKGKFSAIAKRKGVSTQSLARKDYHAKGKLGKEARFAFNAAHKHGLR